MDIAGVDAVLFRRAQTSWSHRRARLVGSVSWFEPDHAHHHLNLAKVGVEGSNPFARSKLTQ